MHLQDQGMLPEPLSGSRHSARRHLHEALLFPQPALPVQASVLLSKAAMVTGT
ncbi:hypothetical protein ACFS7Z_14770 [Pontibacter toksunensis]|uniref:Uncharacterized protein n=1 Tax=Pontibacter toksunensis TaxID=1332631 RepID=A0ABW6BXC1_9BACT